MTLADKREIRVVLARIDRIVETPKERNSRVRYDGTGLDELAASIREHGVLQPIVVRPAVANQTPSDGGANGECEAYVVVAGNRRLLAARAAGLSSVPCMIRVTDADEALILNVVENLQRLELSGRERVRALVLLANLADETGRPLGVREISRRTGLATGTISTWLRIHRRPRIMAALEGEGLDIGRAMVLVSAPDECLTDLIARASSLSQPELKAEVAAARRAARPSKDSEVADARHALAAYRALERVQRAPAPVREVLTQMQQRITVLLAEDSLEATVE